MKTIVIFTRNFRADALPFSNPRYFAGYQDLLMELKSAGAAAYFASGNEHYKGAGRFSEAWTSDVPRPIADYKMAHDVTAGLVLEKGGFTGTDVMVLNPPAVHTVASDKAETYRHFSKFQPKTIVVDSETGFEAAVRSIETELVVVKEAVSNKGQAVTIAEAEKQLLAPPGQYPVVVQEFIDTSVGIPGLADGVHDLRVKVTGGTIIGGQVRQPAPGELRANIALGGTSRILGADEIPEPVRQLTREIDLFFTGQPRYYALDFANTPNGWKLIELNSKPGLMPNSDGAEAARQTRAIAHYMIGICP